jgi:energy-coupling factor transport system ATP-binding protein
VLILDEPTAGLDPRGRERILQMIRRYQQENHTTVLLVSHSMEDVARVADRVLVLDHGRVAMFETVENIFSHSAELQSMGLAVPAVTQVFEQLRAAGVPVTRSVFTVEQAYEELDRLFKGGASDVLRRFE